MCVCDLNGVEVLFIRVDVGEVTLVVVELSDLRL